MLASLHPDGFVAERDGVLLRHARDDDLPAIDECRRVPSVDLWQDLSPTS